MEKTRYAVWFLGTVLAAIAALAAFNAWAEHFILAHPAGGSVQTLSGFERAVKPAWLEVDPTPNRLCRLQPGARCFRSGLDRSGTASAQLQLRRVQHVAL